jgi:hypothetical protein
VCHDAENPVFMDKSGVFHIATHIQPCAKTMRGACEKGALRD